MFACIRLLTASHPQTMQLRGRLDHAAESLELTRAQAEEMEGKHYVMAEQWCRTLAAQGKDHPK